MSSDEAEDASVHSDAEERILSTGLLTIRLERLIKRVLSSPLQREFLTRAELRVPKHLDMRDMGRAVMDKVNTMDTERMIQLLKEAMFCQLRAASERASWYTFALHGQAVVTSPRGRRKIARHIEHALDGTADALVDRLQEAVWVVLFSRHQLQGLKSARRHTPVTATALVWYPGEPALYCSRPKPAGRLLAAVSAGLGFSEARPYPLSGRKLSTMRLMFTAKKSRRFHDCELPADEYPLEM
ncbi:uncharacterized protein LOC122389010 [Amphibalanus amphitrite]|uniref:uncharacterized protein LOC122389010 n=1 Tax=Amphibalanus amphitrite TaxID=1232801 RepID=UPI001C90A29F|nr:uncharacterized protein LOC122389010 [Amphibalanus amphitrite]XP_043236606.1 uncharacterized protein LOC122389010 [Amphibalanus amphitrite]XP_043236607.1 uncharacterized protein LOC122389010 [Amphibalanus amphitrite]XP_043236608.1 uncharacterized protein LOC122389010 [Amphibalanus amphitrite]